MRASLRDDKAVAQAAEKLGLQMPK